MSNIEQEARRLCKAWGVDPDREEAWQNDGLPSGRGTTMVSVAPAWRHRVPLVLALREER